MQISEDELDLTCEYICFSGKYVLAGGSAPEGYYCPLEFGNCSTEGGIINGPPYPIEEEPIPDPEPPIGEGLRTLSTASSESNSDRKSVV